MEINNASSGLLIEVWTKGMIWDRALGYRYIPLHTIPYSTEETIGKWYPLDTELILMDGEVAGTKIATGHMILLDCRFEIPLDQDPNNVGDLQRKLEYINGMMTTSSFSHDRQQRQAQYLGNSGYSEDSDYTSDLNYPVGGQNANSSASQYRNLRTPQRSLETSRENSYEKDDQHIIMEKLQHYQKSHHEEQLQYHHQHQDFESDPLFYNSRPMTIITTTTSFNNYDNSCINGETDDVGIHSSYSNSRKRSLERQETMYGQYGGDIDYYGDETFYPASDDPYFEIISESDDRWDYAPSEIGGGGGSGFGDTIMIDESEGTITGPYGSKMLPKIPIQHSNSVNDEHYNSDECVSLVSRGASLPATPVSHQKLSHRVLPQPKQQMVNSGTINTRQLPTVRSSGKRKIPDIQKTIADSNLLIGNTCIAPIYNEDYNYAYDSLDNLKETPNYSQHKGAALPTLPSSPTILNNFEMIGATGSIGEHNNLYQSESSSLGPTIVTPTAASLKKSKKLPTPQKLKLPTIPPSHTTTMLSSIRLDNRNPTIRCKSESSGVENDYDMIYGDYTMNLLATCDNNTCNEYAVPLTINSTSMYNLNEIYNVCDTITTDGVCTSTFSTTSNVLLPQPPHTSILETKLSHQINQPEINKKLLFDNDSSYGFFESTPNDMHPAQTITTFVTLSSSSRSNVTYDDQNTYQVSNTRNNKSPSMIVDYSDYKYSDKNDCYEYTENDYIATGDINLSKIYNNNYSTNYIDIDYYDSISGGDGGGVTNMTSMVGTDVTTTQTTGVSIITGDAHQQEKEFNLNKNYFMNNYNCDNKLRITNKNNSTTFSSDSKSIRNQNKSLSSTYIIPSSSPVKNFDTLLSGGAAITKTSIFSSTSIPSTIVDTYATNNSNLINTTTNFNNQQSSGMSFSRLFGGLKMAASPAAATTAVATATTTTAITTTPCMNSYEPKTGLSQKQQQQIMVDDCIPQNHTTNGLVKQTTKYYGNDDEDDEVELSLLTNDNHLSLYQHGNNEGTNRKHEIVSTGMMLNKQHQQHDDIYYNHYIHGDDYFNEEDEYKYLEKEEEEEGENLNQRNISDYHHRQYHHQNLNDDMISTTTMATTTTNHINKLIDDNNKPYSNHQFHPHMQQPNIHYPSSSIHNTLGHINSEYNFIDNHSKLTQPYLSNQDSCIIEEDEEKDEDEVEEDEEEEDEEDEVDDTLEHHRYHVDEIMNEDLHDVNNLKAMVKISADGVIGSSKLVDDLVGSLNNNGEMLTPKKSTPSLKRGETEEITSTVVTSIVSKTEVTAKQRWHWAYNKIIIQLNI